MNIMVYQKLKLEGIELTKQSNLYCIARVNIILLFLFNEFFII